MKKQIILIILIIISKSFFSQTKTVTIDEKGIKWLGTTLVTCSKNASIDIETTDTIGLYISFRFRNANYTHIIDPRSIIFSKNTDLEDFKKFKKDLNSAIENIDSNDPINFRGINYVINVTGNKTIWLYDSKNGYTGFYLKQALKFQEWVNSTEL